MISRIVCIAIVHNHGDFIAFIFKYTYTATRIIINQLSIKCTRTRTITFPQLYSVRSNWKEGGDGFFLLLLLKKTSPDCSATKHTLLESCPPPIPRHRVCPAHWDKCGLLEEKNQEFSMQIMSQARPFSVCSVSHHWDVMSSQHTSLEQSFFYSFTTCYLIPSSAHPSEPRQRDISRIYKRPLSEREATSRRLSLTWAACKKRYS